MAKLVEAVKPIFKAKVNIPLAGGGTLDVEFVFKHRTKSELKAFTAELDEDGDEVKAIQAMAESWSLEDAFDAESIAWLCENCMGAVIAIYQKYRDELVQAKLGN